MSKKLQDRIQIAIIEVGAIVENFELDDVAFELLRGKIVEILAMEEAEEQAMLDDMERERVL